MLPHLLLFFAVVVWGSAFVATKILVAEIGPLEIFALRLAIGLPVLGAIVLVRRVPLRFGRADVPALLAGGAIFTAHVLIQVAGISTTSATNTGWIISVTPLVMAVLAFLLLRERIGPGSVFGIAVATFGVILLVSKGDLTHLTWLRSTGDWLVLASAHTWALFTIATRNVTRRHHPLAVAFAILAVAAAFMAILSATSGDFHAVRALTPDAIVSLLYLSIFGLALGQWFWQEGVARVGATRAGVYLYLEPLATLAVAVPLLGEPFTRTVALGGALVLTGVYMGQRDRQTPQAGAAGVPVEGS